MHPGHENEAGEVKKGQEDGGTDDPEQAGENGFAEGESDPAPRAEDVEVLFPGLEQPRLDAGQTRAGKNEGGHPPEAFFQDEVGREEFGPAEPNENNGEQIGGRTKQEVSEAGHHRADRTDEVFRHRFGCALFAEEEPRRDIGRRIGDQREEEKSAGPEQDEPEHFTPGFAAAFFCCFTASQGEFHSRSGPPATRKAFARWRVAC